MIAKIGVYEEAFADAVKWVNSPNIGKTVLNSGHRRVETGLGLFESGEPIAGTKKVKLSLSQAAAWHFSNAAVQLKSGDSRGWNHYEKFLYFSVWGARIRIRLYLYLNSMGDPYRKPNFLGHADDMIAGLAHPEEGESVSRIGEYFLSEVTEHDLSFDMNGENLPELNALILWLFCQLVQEDWEEQVVSRFPSMSMGIFQPIVDSWHNESSFEKALSDLLDVHLLRMDVREGVHFEFCNPPFSIIPTEYYAIKNVRSKLGLGTPLPKHQLLEEGLFGEMPEILPKGRDTIFDHGILRVQEFFPDI